MDTNKEPVTAIIDLETGEILDEIYEGDILKIKRIQQADFIQNYIKFPDKDMQFVKLYTDTIKYLDDILSPAEFKFMIKLSQSVSYNDCVIRKTSDPRSDIATLSDIGDIVNEKYCNTKKIVRSLTNKGIVGKHNVKDILSDYSGKNKNVYTMNPFVFFKGTYINKNIYKYYNKYKLCNNNTH